MSETRNKSVDSTLRYPYDSLRYTRAEIMAIRFKHLGREYEADTVEEADRLRRLLDDADYERAKHDPDFRDRMNKQLAGWTEEKFWTVVSHLGQQQTKVIVAIYLWTSIRADELATALDLPSQEALAGVMSGLSKQLEKLDVKLGDILNVETYWAGKKKERYFKLAAGFAGATAQLNWGYHWRLEKWAKQMDAKIAQMKKAKRLKN